MEESELVKRLTEEIRNGKLGLDRPKDKEHNNLLNAARVLRVYQINEMHIESVYVPTIFELKTYYLLFQRILELADKDKNKL